MRRPVLRPTLWILPPIAGAQVALSPCTERFLTLTAVAYRRWRLSSSVFDCDPGCVCRTREGSRERPGDRQYIRNAGFGGGRGDRATQGLPAGEDPSVWEPVSCADRSGDQHPPQNSPTCIPDLVPTPPNAGGALDERRPRVALQPVDIWVELSPQGKRGRLSAPGAVRLHHAAHQAPL